jgi:hypothetical protein
MIGYFLALILASVLGLTSNGILPFGSLENPSQPSVTRKSLTL